MSQATADFLLNYKETIPIPDHMPLVCQVLYLFLEFDDDKHRAAQLKDLFYRHDNPDYFRALEETVRKDQETQACFDAAMEAAINGQIEPYDKDYDFEHFERDKLKTPEFYTVSFLAWAESAGHKIPEYITKELGKKIEYYFSGKQYRDEERRKFPEIHRQEFERRANEPLWQMTDAILYALGHQSRGAEDAKINFLKYKDRAKRLMAYALDAHKAHDLKLYDFDDHLFDVDQKDIEEKRLKSFYASKVKPKEFVAWLRGLSLDIPGLGEDIPPKSESQTLKKLLEDEQTFKFCGPSDDPDEITAVTVGYRYLLAQIKAQAKKFLAAPLAEDLAKIDVEINNIYSVYEAQSQLHALHAEIFKAINSQSNQPISVESVSMNKLGFENLLHPIIHKSSYKHYQDGHLRDAVLNSVVAIFDYIREKTGLAEDGDKLIGQAFSLSDPFVVLSELQSESGQNDQKGFMQIYKGAYQGIRNPKAHSLVHDLTEQKAAQYLVFASLLARRIEEASFPKAT